MQLGKYLWNKFIKLNKKQKFKKTSKSYLVLFFY